MQRCGFVACRPTGIFLLFIALSATAVAQKNYTLTSPAGAITLTVRVADSVYYSVAVKGTPVVIPSSIALITSQKSLGVNSHVTKQTTRQARETIVNAVPFKRKNIPDHYRELTLSFRENFALIFRAYDDGVAYRFISNFKDSLIVEKEIATFRFPGEATGYLPLVQKRDKVDIFHTSFEEPYTVQPLSQFKPDQLAFNPVLVDEGARKVVITESDLLNYPGMFVRSTQQNGLRGDFAPYPAKEEIQEGEFKQWIVTARKNYIAKTQGTRSFPWRIIGLAEKDGDLLLNDMPYRLATPAKQTDWSWVTPGIGTDEWICGANLRGVDFKTGINTATYKHYIDFASRFGMQYVMLDAGWSDNNDLLKITPGLDLEAVAAYAKTKNVHIMLWTLAMTLDRQLEEAMAMFETLDVKLILTDFMDRDDQKTVAFYQRMAEAAARHKIMIMFHGAFKGAGFERTYPNAISREAVLGSEYNIWSEKASPEHDLLIPFIRMVGGPMDYEPGFYKNANRETFRPLRDMVMSQGTRCHQLAMFVAYDSPMQIFSGNPSDAWPEIAYTTYLASLPTTWDDTVVPDAKVGDYLVVARRKDNDWYLAAMTDWTPRTISIDLSFLNNGSYRAFTCEDGPNATKNSEDYRMGYALVDKNSKLTITMAPGGGYVVKLIKLNDARP